MIDPGPLLAAHDAQLRGATEAAGAISVHRQGPLHLVTFPGGRALVTYRDLGSDPTAPGMAELVEQVLAHFRAQPQVPTIEWKTRGHDHAPGLHEALVAAGFVPGPPESIMIGRAVDLAVDVPLPAGVTLRPVTAQADVRAASALADEVFGDPVSEHRAEDLLRTLASGRGAELWVAESDGRIVTTGRLEPVPGTEFAGIWGGATRPQWRGRGIYRALTAARAWSALRWGASLIISESTGFSRPILQRSGLVQVSTTTPYTWTPDRG